MIHNTAGIYYVSLVLNIDNAYKNMYIVFMNRETPVSIVFYLTENGNCPVKEFLKELPPGDKALVSRDIRTVQQTFPIGLPLVRKIESGLWEIRSKLQSRICRVFFTVVSGQIILLHGFIKKSQATPEKELKTARERKKSFQ